MEDNLTVDGELSSYTHTADSGATMTKMFCPSCGSQMIGKNSNNEGRAGVRVGVIDDPKWFNPQVSVYTSRKLPSTEIGDVKTFDKMPGG